MRVLSLAGLGLGLMSLVAVSPAQALSISNSDPEAHTITVTVGNDSKELTVAPDQEVDATCADGCKVKLENGEEYDLKGSEEVSIEGGVIFVDASPDANDEDLPDVDPDTDTEATGPSNSAAPDGATSAVPQGQ
jgi:hypothetical protein